MAKLSRRRNLKLFSLCLTLVIGGLLYITQSQQTPSATTQTPAPGFYRIAHFVDGDTIAVIMNDSTEDVRFIGIDTPETHKPNTPVQCFGPEASDFTQITIGTQSVRLVADTEGDNRDRYNRLLRYVYLPDGTLLNELLIQKGYAFAYLSFPFSKKAEFAADQERAETEKIGVWAHCTPSLNGERWQSNTLK